ncbi:hypothetical protein AX15_005854 [Amanita polypyramis BW_CC]|nr:hypothetical protein AX15_005854 [Amanita polypyramis BW_CC]
MSRPPSRAASESGILPPPSPRRPPRSASASPKMDTAPDKVPTPPAEWPIERLTTKLLSCLSTRHLRDIELYGPPALWESLHEGGFGDEYELFNELCNIAFPLYQPLSAAQAEDTATHIGVSLINQARSTPPAPTADEEPATPKGPTITRKPHFEVQDPEVMNVDTLDLGQTESNTQRRAAQLLKRGLALITQLHKLWSASAEIQGKTSHELLEAIRITFHLQGGDPESPTRLTTCGSTLPNTPLSTHTGPSNPSTNIIHAPQPMRPIPPLMPPSRTPRPTRTPRDRAPYVNKGKGQQCSQTPPSSKEGSPRPSSTKSYASKAALSAKETLARAQEVLTKAPSLSIDEAMAVARTLPINPTPKPNNRKSATIQGSRESSCIISTGVLLHQGIIERIQDLILEDQQLALLPVRNIAVSNDRRSIILRSNQTLNEDDIHAFRTLIANATNQSYDDCLPTNRPTYSTAKIEFLPINTSITIETIHNALMRLEVYAEHHTTNGLKYLIIIMGPSSRNCAKNLLRSAPIHGDSSPGSTSQWPDNAPSARSGATHSKYAARDKQYVPFVLSSTPPPHTTTPAGDATRPMLTPSIVPTSTALTVTAPMRPLIRHAHGSSPGPTLPKLNGSMKPNAMQLSPNATRAKHIAPDPSDPYHSA